MSEIPVNSEVANPTWIQQFVSETIASKRKNPGLIGARNKLIQLPETKHSDGQLQAYQRKLEGWLGDPVNVSQEDLGLVFELFSQAFWQRYLATNYPQTQLVVVPSPASFDFMEHKTASQYGPSADLLIGHALGNHFRLQGLISCKVNPRERRSEATHLRFGVPRFTFWNKSLDGFEPGFDLYNFGTSANPQGFLQSWVNRLKPSPLKKFIDQQAL